MKSKTLINKLSVPTNAEWSATQSKTARSSTPPPPVIQESNFMHPPAPPAAGCRENSSAGL